jgi:hypothetical protein
MRTSATVAAILTAALSLCPAAKADSFVREGIRSFRADVTVLESASLDVREEIKVSNAADYYTRGFRWTVPISSNDRWDLRYVPAYEPDNGIRTHILEVTEDGHAVDYAQGSGYTYSQITIGQPNVPMQSGNHIYTLHYTVDYVLTEVNGRDLLYWTAIGVERNAPVGEAILAIHLPATIPRESIKADVEVGGRGRRPNVQPENDLERVDDSTGAIVYRAVNVDRRQSLTMALTWPSGYINIPEFEMIRRDPLLFAAPGIIFLYYLIAWFRIGPDPQPSALQARYEAPDGLSPAAIRYIASGTTDGRTFAAVITQLATRGCLRVESVNGKIKLSQLMSDRATQSALAPEESACLNLLFEDGPTIELSPAMDQRKTAQNGRYVFHIHEQLTQQLSGKYFTRNPGTIALGIVMTLFFAAVLAGTAKGRDTTGAFMFTFWILFMGLMIGMMIEMSFLSAWKTVIRARSGWIKMLPGTLAVGVFLGAIGLILKKLSDGVSLSYALMLVAFLLINLGWAPFLKRKTQVGREVSDQIAGFRQFLQKVEQDRLNRLGGSLAGSSDESGKLDALLPYAIALEVKETWGDQLAQAFLATTVFAEQ